MGGLIKGSYNLSLVSIMLELDDKILVMIVKKLVDEEKKRLKDERKFVVRKLRLLQLTHLQSFISTNFLRNHHFLSPEMLSHQSTSSKFFTSHNIIIRYTLDCPSNCSISDL